MACIRRLAILSRGEKFSSIFRPHHPSLVEFQLLPPIIVSPLISSRAGSGSKRHKRIKERKLKEKLEKQLQLEYGLEMDEKFNQKLWLKENYFSEFKAFQARLDLRFTDHKILMSAFAHPSFLNELMQLQRDKVPKEDKDTRRRFDLLDEVSDIPFQKLSLLGYDTTLLAVKEEVYKKYPSITQSICSGVCNFLTSRETTSNIAKNLAIDDLLLLSKELDGIDNFQEQYHLNFTFEDLLSDAFYSVVGAIVKDLGMDVAKSFVKDILAVLMDYEDLADHVNIDHPQEELRNILSMNVVYGYPKVRLISETGVGSHFPHYYAGVFFKGTKIGDGSGHTTESAREDAFKNSIYSSLEGDIDFSHLRKISSEI